MESDILKFLNFEMGNPTIKTFLRYVLRLQILPFVFSITLEKSCFIMAMSTSIFKKHVDPLSRPDVLSGL